MKAVIFISFLVASLTGCSTFTGLDKQAQLEHDTCMYMLLDNGQVGNSCDWHTNKDYGTLRIIVIKPNMCHILTSTTARQKSTQIEACLSNTNKWIFYSR